jgi:hypothetical protein
VLASEDEDIPLSQLPPKNAELPPAGSGSGATSNPHKSLEVPVVSHKETDMENQPQPATPEIPPSKLNDQKPEESNSVKHLSGSVPKMHEVSLFHQITDPPTKRTKPHYYLKNHSRDTLHPSQATEAAMPLSPQQRLATPEGKAVQFKSQTSRLLTGLACSQSRAKGNIFPNPHMMPSIKVAQYRARYFR